jgi:hypothetical protein
MADGPPDFPVDCMGRECSARTQNYFYVVVNGRQYRVCRGCLGKVLGVLKAD